MTAQTSKSAGAGAVELLCRLGAVVTERFTDQLWQEAAPVWQAIQAHPFLSELRAGTLPIETFQYYVTQDYHYLEAFGRAVATALAKAPTGELLTRVARRVMTPIERPLHEKLFTLAGVAHADAEAARISPTNLAYQNHMLATAARGTLGETAAALLPCPWTYHALGDIVVGVQHPVYSEWAAFYSEGLLAESTRAWRELVDGEVAEGGPRTREAMRRVFHQSMRYEWMFWDMAHRREQWPI